MNRFVRGATAVALLAGGLGSVGCAATEGSVARGAAPDGCAGGGCGTGWGGNRTAMHGDGAVYRTFVDPCWPERYSAAARDEVLDPFRKQVFNGNVMHHTVWNYMFEPGTDRLNPAGQDKLNHLVRTRPYPDPKVYIQTARDVAVTADNMDKVAAQRDDLDARRAAAVQRYLATQPTFNPTVYEVYVHDPVVPGIDSNFASSAYRGQLSGYAGGLRGAGGGGVAATAGGVAVQVNTGGAGGGTTGAAGGGSGAYATPGGSASGPPQ